MSLIKNISLLALILSPGASHAAGVRGYSTDEIAIQKVSAEVLANDLHFVTAPTDNICGSTGIAGTDVKVQIVAAGRFITIRHYGVTSHGIFAREKAVECAQ